MVSGISLKDKVNFFGLNTGARSYMLASCCVLFKEAVTGLGSCVPQKQDPKLLASEG